MTNEHQIFTPAVVIAGIAFGLLVVLFVFATGGTFGQRCAKTYDKGSPAWQECVDDLAAGKREKP